MTTPGRIAQHREIFDYGIMRDDFFRIMPRVLAPVVPEISPVGMTVRYADGRRVLMKVGAQQYRQVARIRMPYVELQFIFSAWNADQIDQFLKDFARAFLKGGG